MRNFVSSSFFLFVYKANYGKYVFIISCTHIHVLHIYISIDLCVFGMLITYDDASTFDIYTYICVYNNYSIEGGQVTGRTRLREKKGREGGGRVFSILFSSNNEKKRF